MQPALQLALLLAILLPAGKVGASLCTRFGIPAILGFYCHGVDRITRRIINCKNLRDLLRLLCDVANRQFLSKRIGQIRQVQQPCWMASGCAPHGSGIREVVSRKTGDAHATLSFLDRLNTTGDEMCCV